MLSGFGEAISIAGALVTADFIPFGRRLLVRSEARAEALQALSCASSESELGSVEVWLEPSSRRSRTDAGRRPTTATIVDGG